MQQVCQNLNGEGYFYVYHSVKRIFCVYRYKRWDNADWAWSHKMCNNAVGPTGKYGLPGITRYTDGKIKGVLNRDDKLYHCLQKGITPNTDKQSHEQLINKKWKGYRLTDSTVANIWGQQIDQMWENYKQQHPHTTFNAKTERKKRIQFAKSIKTGILGISNVSNWCGIFDVCHAWWSWLNYILCFVIMLMWCVWGWTEQEVIYFVACLGVEYITVQVKTYIKDNKTRSTKKWIQINTNGIILKTVIHAWHKALCEAVVIANDKINQGIDTNHFTITLLCVFIRISTLMRKSFGTLLTDKFEWPKDNSTPIKIKELIKDVRLATYLAYNMCSTIVC